MFKLIKGIRYSEIKNSFGIKEQIDNNPKFRLLDNGNIQCIIGTRFSLSEIDKRINILSTKINKHKIIKRLIVDDNLRNKSFYIINLVSLIIPNIISESNNMLNIMYFVPSLLLTAPFILYTTFESNRLSRKVCDIKKYDILDKLEKIYNSVISEFCMFILKLNITNPVDIMILFDEAISSLVDQSEINKEEYNELTSNIEDNLFRMMDTENIDLLGYNVLLGYSVCRHKAVILKDIYLKLGFKAKVCALNFLPENSGHSIVMIDTGNAYMYIDPENLCNYKIRDGHLLSEDETIELSNVGNILEKIKFKMLGWSIKYKTNKPITYKKDISIRREYLLCDRELLLNLDILKTQVARECGDFIKTYHEVIDINSNMVKTL